MKESEVNKQKVTLFACPFVADLPGNQMAGPEGPACQFCRVSERVRPSDQGPGVSAVGGPAVSLGRGTMVAASMVSPSTRASSIKY